MFKTLLSALLLSAVAIAQAPPASKAPSKPAETAAEIAPTAPVITIAGFCPNAPASIDKKSADCKTVITKAEFEKIIDTLNPKMPPQARQNVAQDYAKMLVFSTEARKRGLEETPRFQELVKFVKMQVAAQELVRSLQEKTKPSDAEVKKYYDDNASKFEEMTLKRIFIPRNSPNAKPTDPRPTDETLKAEGEKIRTRLVAGEDFDKIEKEIYDEKGYKTPPPPTTIPNWRRESAPPSQEALFDLKQGELSQVMVEPAGVYIYKIEEKKTIPLDTVKTEIESQLGNQKMRTAIDEITASFKPELNEAYFRSGMPGPGVIGPAGVPGPPSALKTGPRPPDRGPTPNQ